MNKTDYKILELQMQKASFREFEKVANPELVVAYLKTTDDIEAQMEVKWKDGNPVIDLTYQAVKPVDVKQEELFDDKPTGFYNALEWILDKAFPVFMIVVVLMLLILISIGGKS